MNELDGKNTPPYVLHDDGKICGFFGTFRFLDTSFILIDDGIYFDGLYYPSVFHAYQAAKWPKDQRDQFTRVTSGQAKKLGQEAPNLNKKRWDLGKYDLMYALNWNKYSKIWKMKQMLLMTDGCHLEERNNWGDMYWGTNEKGEGDNNLGKILMIIRERLSHGIKNEF